MFKELEKKREEGEKGQEEEIVNILEDLATERVEEDKNTLEVGLGILHSEGKTSAGLVCSGCSDFLSSTILLAYSHLNPAPA